MSRRSRQSAPAITLFSFQDIIMSTSGIMIMIVLILCLELIQRPEISASASPPSIDSTSLETTISQLQQEIQKLEREIENANSLIHSASQMTASERDEQIRNLQTVNRLLLAKRDELRKSLTELEAHDAERSVQRDELAQLQIHSRRLQQEIAGLNQDLKSDAQNARQIFSLPRGENRSGWIVDISAARISVAPIGRAEKPVSFANSQHRLLQSGSSRRAFLNWTKGLGANTYFFLFVRPDGVEIFQEISREFEQSRISFGFDLAESEQVLLHPERGAAE